MVTRPLKRLGKWTELKLWLSSSCNGTVLETNLILYDPKLSFELCFVDGVS